MTREAQASDIHAYPPDVTFHDLIQQNKRRSLLLMVAMGALTVAVVVAIGVAIMVLGGGVSWEGIAVAAVVALIVVIGATTWSYYGGGKTVLRISGAKKLKKEADPELFNVVEELAIAAGVPMPEVYVINSKAPNAFATGRDPEHAAVAITRGLRKKLTRDELQGVMAHEMAHVRHYDIRLTMLVATLAGLIVLASDMTRRMLFYGALTGGGRRHRRGGMGMRLGGGGGRGGGRGGGGRGGGGAAVAMLILIAVAVFLAVIAPLLAKLIQMSVSRQREYLADAGAVELTRYPKGLADALRKLSADHTELKQANRATAHMYIINPVLNARNQAERRSLFNTHPPASDRIARLEALMR